MSEQAAVVGEVVKADALAPAFVGLEPSSARQVREAFLPALLQIEEWEHQAKELTVTDESQTAKMEMASVMRKALKKVRVGVDKKRKELNADALARTKAINCAAGIVEGLIVPLEKHLQEQETFAERAAEGRRSALREARGTAVKALGGDPSVYADLGSLSEEEWSSALGYVQAAHNERREAARHAEAVRVEAARIEAARREEERQAAIKADAERVAREKAQAEENARLRAEAVAREAEAKAERERVEAERKAEREKAAVEAAAREGEARKAREEAARLAAELEAKHAQEREKARKAEEAEAARLGAIAAEAARKAAAPDREKLLAFATALRRLETPELSTPAGKDFAFKIAGWLSRGADWVEGLAGELGAEDAAQ